MRDHIERGTRLHGEGKVVEVSGRLFRVRAEESDYTVSWAEDARWSCSCPTSGECSHMYAAARLIMLQDPEEHTALEGLWDGFTV